MRVATSLYVNGTRKSLADLVDVRITTRVVLLTPQQFHKITQKARLVPVRFAVRMSRTAEDAKIVETREPASDDDLVWIKAVAYRGCSGTLFFITPKDRRPDAEFELCAVRCNAEERIDPYDDTKFPRTDDKIGFMLAPASRADSTSGLGPNSFTTHAYGFPFYDDYLGSAHPLTERRNGILYYPLGGAWASEKPKPLKPNSAYWLLWSWTSGKRKGSSDAAPMMVGLRARHARRVHEDFPNAIEI